LAASPQNSGVQMHPLWDVPDGIVAALEGSTYEFPPISMLTLENTYMVMSGAPTGVDEMRTLVGLGHDGGLPVHVDGARIWNAAIATGAPPAELIGGADTVMFCLSKGLSAPVGSMLCGPADVIAEARVHRRRLGGGMRQAGVIAAAGIVALETMVDRLGDDHVRAKRIADALAERWPGSVDPATIHTNIVCARLEVLPDKFIERLATAGVRAGTIDPRTLRFVTHKDVDDDGIARTIAAFDELRGG
jgi:threonine aldolase